MKKPYHIEEINDTTLPQALQLVWEVFLEFEAPEYSEAGIQEFRDFIAYPFIQQILRDSTLAMWGCFDFKKITGVIAARKPCHIALLFVKKEYHRQGIARALYNHVLSVIETTCAFVTVNSSPYAQKAYERLGFVTTDAEQTVNGLRFIPMRHTLPLRFRKAAPADLEELAIVYHKAIRAMEQKGIYQWDKIYPTKNDLKEDIAKEELFIGLLGGKIACAFAVNTAYDPEYETGHWQYPTASFSVVHRLCVNPDFQNKGIGSQTMRFIERQAKDNRFETIRLDAFSQNPAALKLYKKLGYTSVGSVQFRKGTFILFEKKIR